MLYAIVAAIALILDQAMKYWTTSNIVLNTGEKTLIPGLIKISHIHNTGAAFSFLDGARWFFVVLCLIFVAVIIYVLVKNIIDTPVARWMAVLVMAGAVGNCIDRVISGYVVDMLEFDFMFFGKFAFPVFNIADIYITLGGIIFCLCILFEKKRVPEGEESAPAVEPRRKTAPAKAPAAKAAPVKNVKSSKSSHSKAKAAAAPARPVHPQPKAPAINPSDPFAEWEHKNQATAQAASPQGAREFSPATPEAASYGKAAPISDEARAAATAAAQAELAELNASKKPHSLPQSAPPAAPAHTASGSSSDFDISKVDLNTEFDLDSILEEFKDL